MFTSRRCRTASAGRIERAGVKNIDVTFAREARDEHDVHTEQCAIIIYDVYLKHDNAPHNHGNHQGESASCEHVPCL